ncbi:MAG: shikimate dehydrogenase [Pyrinomonadaceae bacterium]
MNDGKICISVCAETSEELIEQMMRAKLLADVIELRFDCLKKIEPEKIWSSIKLVRQTFDGKLLATFRSTEQGGKINLTFAERKEFWLDSGVSDFVDWADFELDFPGEDINQSSVKVFEKILKSFHDFKKIPPNSDEIYKQTAVGSETLKIALQTDEIADTIAVWKILERARSDNKEIVPIAMGEAGKWTRILGLAHGALMTYAALDEGSETAPGQISARDLIETYRVKELTEKTDVYGIVGHPVAHSLSPFMHNAAFRSQNIDAVYIPFEVKNLDEFIKRFVKSETREVELNIKGFSVTIPHKTAIIKHLDFIDETAEKIGAVNTVNIERGKLCGYNTDAEGFIEPLKNIYGDLSGAKIALLGAGGAARACVYALVKQKANVQIFARNVEKAQSLADEFKVRGSRFKVQGESYEHFDIVVNTTPLGTKGVLENQTPATAEQIQHINLIYDLVYNPFETQLIKEAKQAFVPTIGGMAMLVGQAMAQFKAWTGKDAPLKEMSAAVLKRLS